MRFSQYLLHTHREAPAEAEVVSHRLMLRANMIRKLAAGIYIYLPLGLRSIRKLEAIVRDEMNRAGAQELLMPAVQPAELWQESGRWQVYGKELLRLKDRHDRDFCVGPTHEEVITDIGRKEIRSYRDLPRNLYQIQTKFRDEVRPRFGLMRGREFIMKDAYSFDVDSKAAQESYWKMYKTYQRIFKRCGLKFRAVEALTGAIGGSLSHEFQVLAESGEDVIIACDACEYAANIEKAEAAFLPFSSQSVAQTKFERKEVSTPGKRSVEAVTAFLNIKPEDLIKTLVYAADGGFIAACVRGDREVNEHKLKTTAGVSELRLATAEETQTATSAPLGFAGPVGLKIPVYVARELDPHHAYVCGANKTDAHFQNVYFERDFKAKKVGDLCLAKAGDVCPRCRKNLSMHRGIEVGQVFYLGTKYSEAMKATYLDAQGKDQITEMGCYGIGIGRTVAAAIEQNHDDKGIIFPMALAPFQVVLVSLAGGKDEETGKRADEIYEQLLAAGVDVLYDDRDERAGVKFTDAELIGIPLQVVVGKKGLQEGQVELKMRAGGQMDRIPLGDIARELQARIQKALAVEV